MKPIPFNKRFIPLCLLLFFLTELSIAQVTIVPYGSTWKYWANSQANYPANWQTVGFDDSAWPSGAGELGYGDGDESTCIPAASPIAGTLCTPFRLHHVPPSSFQTEVYKLLSR